MRVSVKVDSVATTPKAGVWALDLELAGSRLKYGSCRAVSPADGIGATPIGCLSRKAVTDSRKTWTRPSRVCDRYPTESRDFHRKNVAASRKKTAHTALSPVAWLCCPRS